MLWLQYGGVLLMAYLIGAVPVGYLLAKWIRGIDIRRVGSGHTGGTNVLRSAGLVAGLATVVVDLLKGYGAIMLAKGLFPDAPWLAALAGVAAVVGHNYSVFLSWRGGVGSMTTVGATVALMPLVAALIALVGGCMILIWRYSSVASLTVAGLLPILCLVGVLRGDWSPGYLIFAVATGALSAWELRANIGRLRAGTERRVGQTISSQPGEEESSG